MASDGAVKAIESWMNMIETFGESCPRCGAALYRPKVLSRQTHKKMAGACMKCGYKQPLTTKVKKQAGAPELERSSRKNKTIGYYLAFSIRPNDTVITKDFGNFHAQETGQKQLLLFGQGVANQIIAGKTVHALMYGAAGVGKTHIANGILIEVQKKSDFRMTTLFVDWQMLLSKRKEAISHPDVQKKVDGTMQAIREADVAVIDDLGAERGSDFDSDLANEVFRVREDKSTIITTNLGGKALSARYGERTMSRMAKHGQGNTLAVKGVSDQRKTGGEQ